MLPCATRIAVAALIAAGAAAPTSAQHCRVDPVRGDDATADGSATLPFRSLTATLARNCQWVHLAPGEYSAATGERFPISVGGLRHILGAPGLASVLRSDGLAVLDVTSIEGAGCGWIDGVRFVGSAGSGRAPATAITYRHCTRELLFTRNRVEGFRTGVQWSDPLWWLNGRSRDTAGFFHANAFRDNDLGLELTPFRSFSGVFRDRSLIENNVFDSGGVGLRLGAELGAPSASLVRHNTFHGMTGASIVLDAALLDPWTMEPVLRNNIFSRGGGVAIDDALGVPSVIEGCVFDANAGGRWVNGAYANATNLDADPSFVDAAAGDFHLAAGSAILDVGVVTDVPPIDADDHGRPQDGDGDATPETDPGAFERGSARGVLRRGESTVPGRDEVPFIFPMTEVNPYTPVVLQAWQDGDAEPPSQLPRVTIAFFHSSTGETLLVVRDVPGAAVRFHGR